MIKLNVQALSMVGMVRDNNEDMLSLGGILLRDEEMSLPPIVMDENSQFYLLVSDGMGGHEQGERASKELLEYLNGCFKDDLFQKDTIEDDLRFHVKKFNDELNEKAQIEGQFLAMGCTLTGMVWSQGKVLLLNSGDSRTYRFRDGILRQLTQDETVRGLSGNPNDSKALVNCIGANAKGDLTVEDITDRLQNGDSLLLCSDGLTDMLADEDIEQILSSSPQPVDELYEAACERGGFDNVSIIVAKIL